MHFRISLLEHQPAFLVEDRAGCRLLDSLAVIHGKREYLIPFQDNMH